MKQVMPPMRTRTALACASNVVEVTALKFTTNPKLKISNSAPKIIPLIPASDNIRFVAKV